MILKMKFLIYSKKLSANWITCSRKPHRCVYCFSEKAKQTHKPPKNYLFWPKICVEDSGVFEGNFAMIPRSSAENLRIPGRGPAAFLGEFQNPIWAEGISQKFPNKQPNLVHSSFNITSLLNKLEENCLTHHTKWKFPILIAILNLMPVNLTILHYFIVI